MEVSKLCSISRVGSTDHLLPGCVVPDSSNPQRCGNLQCEVDRSPSGKTRRYCTCCNGKFYSGEMLEVYYPLLRKTAFHCRKCVSANADNLQYNLREKDLYLLELFAGSKTVSKTAAACGFQTFTIDIEEKFAPDLVADISQLNLKLVPGREKVFMIWASVPCTVYSVLSLSHHWEKITYAFRKYYYIPKTKEARFAAKLLEKTLYIIRKINPVYFFIENPRGALRHMPQMASIPFLHTVSYADYGLQVYKPTDIFTNCPFLKLHEISSSVGRDFGESIVNMNNAYQRSIVPALLVQSILTQVLDHHKINPQKAYL